MPETGTAQTIRITATTFSSEHVAPDGSHRFAKGLVVPVREGAQTVDAATARRWIRNGFAEEYQGRPGETVRDEVRTASASELASQIQALQAELAQRTQAEGGVHPGYVARAAAGTLAGGDAGRSAPDPARDQYGAEAARPGMPGASLPADRETRAAYLDPEAPHPLADYDLPEKQRDALVAAGFTRPEIVEQASDEDILAVEGVGEAALARLRAKRGR